MAKAKAKEAGGLAVCDGPCCDGERTAWYAYRYGWVLECPRGHERRVGAEPQSAGVAAPPVPRPLREAAAQRR